MSKEYYHIPRKQLEKIDKLIELLNEEGINTRDLFVSEAIESFIDTMKTLYRDRLKK